MRKIVLLGLMLCLASPSRAMDLQRVNVPQFGPSWLYKTDTKASLGFIALLSPSTGWDNMTALTARRLVHEGYMVLGLDTKAYNDDRQKGDDECLFPGGLIEGAAQDFQKSPAQAVFHRPIVIGLGDSGGIAAAAMFQNLPGTMRAVIAPSFCPVASLAVPLCTGARMAQEKGVYRLSNSDALKPDEGFYAAAIPSCATLDKNWPVVARNSSVQDFIDDSLATNRKKTQPEAIDGLEDLPLTYLPAEDDTNDWLVILISGDGGWRDIDRQLGENLQQAGYAVIGVDSLRYFWQEKTPEDTAAMLDRIVTTTEKAWDKKRVVLLGYSFGADVLPLSYAKMKTAASVKLMGFMSFARYALFEITAGSYLGVGDERYDNLKAMQTMPHPVPTLCLFGQSDVGSEEPDDQATTQADDNDDMDDDDESLCPKLHQPWVEQIGLPGGHHFDGNYEALTKLVIERLQRL